MFCVEYSKGRSFSLLFGRCWLGRLFWVDDLNGVVGWLCFSGLIFINVYIIMA